MAHKQNPPVFTHLQLGGWLALASITEAVDVAHLVRGKGTHTQQPLYIVKADDLCKAMCASVVTYCALPYRALFETENMIRWPDCKSCN